MATGPREDVGPGPSGESLKRFLGKSQLRESLPSTIDNAEWSRGSHTMECLASKAISSQDLDIDVHGERSARHGNNRSRCQKTPSAMKGLLQPLCEGLFLPRLQAALTGGRLPKRSRRIGRCAVFRACTSRVSKIGSSPGKFATRAQPLPLCLDMWRTASTSPAHCPVPMLANSVARAKYVAESLQLRSCRGTGTGAL